MKLGMRRRTVALVAVVLGLGMLLLSEAVAEADGAAPVLVTMTGPRTGVRPVRVQISEGRTTPCDSSENTKLFDGWLAPGDTFHGTTAGECVCVRNTSAAFVNTDWSPSWLACRPRVCRGRVCRPLPDPTIRAVLSSG